ncbi:MAG: T9SS type A sorting domain-containing protein [Bacteroidales bacterium]|nr:T9SS type A sorting domain-containing protein [Bacteroidales bacterium]
MKNKIKSKNNKIFKPIYRYNYKKTLFFFIACIISFHLSAQHYYKLSIKQPIELKADAGPDKIINIGENVQIGGISTATGGTPDYSYQWEPSNVLNNSNIPNPIASPQKSTKFIVTVYDKKNCSSSDTINVEVTIHTGLDDVTSLKNNLFVIKEYNNGNLNLIFKNNLNSPFTVSFYNLTGKLIYSEKIDNTKNNEVFFNIPGLTCGLYLIRLHSNSINTTTKLFIK